MVMITMADASVGSQTAIILAGFQCLRPLLLVDPFHFSASVHEELYTCIKLHQCVNVELVVVIIYVRFSF